MSEQGAELVPDLDAELARWYRQSPDRLTTARAAVSEMVERLGPYSCAYKISSQEYIAVTWAQDGYSRDPSGVPALMRLQFFRNLIQAREELPGWRPTTKPSDKGKGTWFEWTFEATDRSSASAPARLVRWQHCGNGCDPHGPGQPFGTECDVCGEKIGS